MYRNSRKIYFSLLLLISTIATTFSSDCSRKWLSGYRLASGRPQKILNSVSFKQCEEECVSTIGCAAFAYGTSPVVNGTCELAIVIMGTSTNSFGRTSRSLNNSLEFSDLDKAPPYDVYTIDNNNENCFVKIRSPLFSNSITATSASASTAAVPIDCFYRLMSGRRLAKTHALKSISVNNLQECQEGCISERSFACRSISYRYMPSGYSYSVSNCELSPFYLNSERSSTASNHDFIEDFDYDFFQREPFCKTSSSIGGLGGSGGGGNFGVCAVVVRRGGKLTNSLIKTSHQVSSNAQCEHFCTTALFRCRAFAFRHTERGRDRDDPFRREQNDCQLYETDLSRLPSYNIETDQDYDLFEMGRLMQGSCMLQGQFHGNSNYNYEKYQPVTSTYRPFTTDRDRYHHYRPEDRTDYNYYPHRPSSNYPISNYPPAHNNYYPPNNNYHNSLYPPTSHHGNSNNYYPNYPLTTPSHPQQSKLNDDNNFPQPPPTQSTVLIDRLNSNNNYNNNANNHHTTTTNNFNNGQHNEQQHNLLRPPLELNDFNVNSSFSSSSSSAVTPPYYDKRREVCLVKLRGDAYLVPDVSRATFPVKSEEECRLECLRSEDVLRFPCNFMAFRLTSHAGGTCQLSDSRDIREIDYIPGTTGNVYAYDEMREHVCARRKSVSNYYPPNEQRYDYYNRGSGGGGYYSDTGSNRRYDTDYKYSPSAITSTGGYYDSNRRYGGSSGSYGSGNYGSGGYGNGNYGSGSYGSGSYGSGSYGSGSYGGGSYNDKSYYGGADGIGGSGLMTTVDGERCLHSCVRNKDAGFYYCQIDSEGAWNFCCRPDEGGQCGYSKGLSFSWCYVGTGPSRNIWRTCNRRGSYSSTKSSSSYGFYPQVSYLHDRQPPTVHTLSSVNEIANLTRDAALELVEQNNSPSDQKSSSNNNNNEKIIVLTETEDENLSNNNVTTPTVSIDSKNTTSTIKTKRDPRGRTSGSWGF